jgi:hypothetical protein
METLTLFAKLIQATCSKDDKAGREKYFGLGAVKK